MTAVRVDRARAGNPLPDTDRVLDELADLRRRVEALEAGRPTVTPDDREQLARLLPAIAGALGSELWTVRELRKGDYPGVRVVLGDLSAKRLGRLLARACGQAINGLVLRRVGSEAHAALWQVVARVQSAS